MNTTSYETEYYITPYTFLTVFSILWAFTSCMRALYMPVKLVYGIVYVIQNLIGGILYLGVKRNINGARNN